MKLYLKRTGLFYLYNTLAIFAGELTAAIPIVILRAIFKTDGYTVASNLISGIGCYICTVSFLLFLMHRDIYENRKFSFTTVVLPAITVCVIRWIIWYLSKGNAAFWVTGGATHFTSILFPDTLLDWWTPEYVQYHLISTIICDLLITVPAFLVGGYWGYKHRAVENKKMIKEHKEQTQ